MGHRIGVPHQVSERARGISDLELGDAVGQALAGVGQIDRLVLEEGLKDSEGELRATLDEIGNASPASCA